MDAWLTALRTRSGLTQRIDSIRAELARNIHHLSTYFLLTATVRLHLAREETLAAIFASFTLPNRAWFETFHDLRQLSADRAELYRTTFIQLRGMQDRWAFAFVLRHTWPCNGIEKTRLPGLIENQAVTKDQASSRPARAPRRSHPCAGRLAFSPFEITALLLQFASTPNLQRSLSASLHVNLHKTPLPALAESYLSLSPNG